MANHYEHSEQPEISHRKVYSLIPRLGSFYTLKDSMSKNKFSDLSIVNLPVKPMLKDLIRI
jgi:hypothetical protein